MEVLAVPSALVRSSPEFEQQKASTQLSAKRIIACERHKKDASLPLQRISSQSGSTGRQPGLGGSRPSWNAFIGMLLVGPQFPSPGRGLRTGLGGACSRKTACVFACELVVTHPYNFARTCVFCLGAASYFLPTLPTSNLLPKCGLESVLNHFDWTLLRS